MIKIGTRGSKLALIQANYIALKLHKLGFKSTLCIIKTTGDAILDRPLHSIGGKGLFTKELERALLDKKIDIAVHSLKDVPVVLDPRLPLCAITKREDARDVLISRDGFLNLKSGAYVGTTSLRRSMQLKMLRADLDSESLRGNVQTRLSRLRLGAFDAIVLAKAALDRLELELSDLNLHVFPPDQMIPAMGQGALGIQAREDCELKDALLMLNDPESAFLCGIERDFVRELSGSCSTPLGVHASREVGESGVTLSAIYGVLDHSRNEYSKIIKRSLKSDRADLGVILAREFKISLVN